MPRSKDFPEDVRRRVVEAHVAGKGYKTISKMCALHHSTVRKIIYKWKTFNTISTRPRTGRPTKMATVLQQLRRGCQSREVTTEDVRANREESAQVSGCQSREVTTEDVRANREESAQVSEDEIRNPEEAMGSAEGEGDMRVSGCQSREVTTEDVRANKEESAQVSDEIRNPEEAMGSAEGDMRVSGVDPAPDCAGLAAGVEDNASMTLVLPDVPALTRKTTKRIRRKEKTKNLEPKCKQDLGSHPSSAERHTEVMLCCEICSTCFTTETDLESHQAQHLEKTLHECEECGRAFQSIAGLRAHRKRKHGC